MKDKVILTCAVTGGDEVGHALGNSAVLDAGADRAASTRNVSLARAEAFGNYRAQVVGDELVERPVAVREVRG